MSNVDIIDDNLGETMSEEKASQHFDWKNVAQWAVGAILMLFLWNVNAQAGDLKDSIRTLNTNVQVMAKEFNDGQIRTAERMARLETVQALQAAQCK